MQKVDWDGKERPWQTVEGKDLAAAIAESLAEPEVKQVRVRRLTSSERRKLKREQYAAAAREVNVMPA